MKIPNILASLVEDDEPKAKQVPPPQSPQPAPVVPAPASAGAASTTITAPADLTDSAYQNLLAKTDLASNHAFQTINKHLAPISGLALDEKTKFKIAVQQAQALDGLQPSALMDVFAQMKSVLESEAQKFAQTIAKAMDDRVETPKAKAAELSTQIQKLQAQVAQLTEESFTSQQKIQSVQHRFDVALSTRQTELAQEQAKYTSLLGE